MLTADSYRSLCVLTGRSGFRTWPPWARPVFAAHLVERLAGW